MNSHNVMGRIEKVRVDSLFFEIGNDIGSASTLCRADCKSELFTNVINILAASLAVDMWLRLSTSFSQETIIQHPGLSTKPCGIWSSKGDRLFYGMTRWSMRSLDEQVILRAIKVDYTNICVITTLNELKFFSSQFSYKKFGDYYFRIDWSLVAEKYSGIAILPFLYPKVIEKMGSDEAMKSFGWLRNWHVSSLVFWNYDCVIGIQDLGTFGSPLGDFDITIDANDEGSMMTNVIKIATLAKGD